MTEPWPLPPKRPFRVIEHEPIAMADGVRLSARLWLPEGGERVPAVLEYIPYRKRDGYRSHDDLWGPVLAAHGFAYARVDVRGSGDSEGLLTDEYSEAELSDGVAIVGWLSAQPWCSGAVGMRGISWGGINTLQIAALRPPALKAIMPMGCCTNRFTDDAHYIGGTLGHTNFQWGAAFKTVMAGPPHPSVVGDGWRDAWRARLEASPPILETWLRHQRFDGYWRRGSVTRNPAAIHCPTYVVDGWSDTYTNAVDELLRTLSGPRKGLVGPWGHTYPYTAAPQGLDWAHEELRWWAHWLKGEATGIMDEPMLRVFMPYATAAEALPEPTPGRWIAEAAWPSPAVRETAFRLSAAAPGPHICAGAAAIGLAKAEWLDRLPGEQSADDAHCIVFETAPLDADLEILGRPRLALRLSADRPVAHLAARLTEVAPDGRSWLAAYAVLNLTHRASHADPTPLDPGAPVDVDLEMAFTAHRFRQGARLRVAVSESLWPLVWPSPQPVTLTLDVPRDGVTLTLPIRPTEPEPAPFAVPEQLGPAPPAPPPVAMTKANGRLRLESRSSRGRIEVSDIVPGDPGSCRWSQTNRAAWSGDGFDCRLEAGYELTADAAHFHLAEWLSARDGETVVFERRTEAKIRRELL